MSKNICQYIIDFFRGKDFFLKHNIKGENNLVITKYKNTAKKIVSKSILSKIKISGKNNKIIFHTKQNKNLTKFPEGIDISINGNNNLIEIFDTKFEHSSISMSGDSNLFSLKNTINLVCGMEVYVSDGGSVIIEEDCEIGNGDLYIVVNGDYKKKHKLIIKKGTHIAREAIIRTSDGECLVNSEGMPISEPQDIIIGENCWIMSRCIILKGSFLPNNTLVGANSLVNKRFFEEYTLIVGSPAKIVKSNVWWIQGKYNINMQKYEQKYIKRN